MKEDGTIALVMIVVVVAVLLLWPVFRGWEKEGSHLQAECEVRGGQLVLDYNRQVVCVAALPKEKNE